jgi:hypothetical protein
MEDATAAEHVRRKFRTAYRSQTPADMLTRITFADDSGH